MSVVAIDTAGARALGEELLVSSGRADDIHGRLLTVMSQNQLPTQAAAGLAAGRDALRTLGVAVVDRAELAESFTVDPAGTAASLGAPENDLRSAVTALLGFAGTRSLRDVLRGLPAQGADPALDAAIARLTPTLLPALLAGERPELSEQLHADLRALALALGIAAAGPRVAALQPDEAETRRDGLFRFLGTRSTGGTEVFHHDFWADGRTPQEVLDDPEQLLAWVSETFELDRRLTLATETPGLVDILQTHDFAQSAETTVAELVAEVGEKFAAIEQYLPALLSGASLPAPDAVQAEQIVAFATRVGWIDTTSGGVDARVADALAYLTANRVLAAALLPSAFEANGVALPFFDATGIGFALDLGVRRGLIDDPLVAGLGATVDAVAGELGIDLTAATPPPVDEAFEQEFLAPLVAAQIGAQGAASPSINLAFQQVLPYLRSASSGAELRDRLIEALAAFRTLAVVGVPALTERQLTALVGDQVVEVVGRSRLRRRSESFTNKNPEFIALALQWGIPGSEKIKTKKHKFTFSFDETGQLTGIRRKKRSFGSRISDAFKGIIKGIGDAFEENPLKAIFEVGKIALNVAALIFPPTSGLGIAAMAVNAAGAVASAVEGDWLGALSSGLGVFTGGANLGGITDVLSLSQAMALKGIIDPGTLDLLSLAKSGVDAARAATAAIAAESPLAALAAGAQAVSTGLGGLGLFTKDADLLRLATTFKDLQPVISGVGATIAAIDGGDLLAAVGNGLGALAAGAGALADQAGAAALLGVDPATVAGLQSLAKTTGVAGSLVNAVAAADRGELFRVGSFLLQAVDQVTLDPRLGIDPLKVGTEIANLGAILEGAVAAGVASPALAGAVLQQLGRIGATLNGKVENTLDPPLPTRRPADLVAVAAGSAVLPGMSIDNRSLDELLGAPPPASAIEGFLLVSSAGQPTAAETPASAPVAVTDPLDSLFLLLPGEALATPGSTGDPFATPDLSPIVSVDDPKLQRVELPADLLLLDPTALPGSAELFFGLPVQAPEDFFSAAGQVVNRAAKRDSLAEESPFGPGRQTVNRGAKADSLVLNPSPFGPGLQVTNLSTKGDPIERGGVSDLLPLVPIGSESGFLPMLRSVGEGWDRLSLLEQIAYPLGAGFGLAFLGAPTAVAGTVIGGATLLLEKADDLAAFIHDPTGVIGSYVAEASGVGLLLDGGQLVLDLVPGRVGAVAGTIVERSLDRTGLTLSSLPALPVDYASLQRQVSALYRGFGTQLADVVDIADFTGREYVLRNFGETVGLQPGDSFWALGPTERGKVMHYIFGENTPPNTRGIDIDPDTAGGVATSIKTVNLATSYPVVFADGVESSPSLRNTLSRGLDRLVGFDGTVRTLPNGELFIIEPGDIEGRVLEVVVPDVPLSQGHQRALVDIRNRAEAAGAGLKIRVFDGTIPR
ncbi:MAG: hypothetical protein ACFCUP_16955 [Actinomycetales bacterium]